MEVADTNEVRSEIYVGMVREQNYRSGVKTL